MASTLEKGGSRLQSKVAADIASYGGQSWRTYGAMSHTLRRPDGGRYHAGSIGRACRTLARNGVIASTRIGPNQPLPSKRPDGRPNRSTYGTTNKRVIWAVLGVRNPVTRGERRRAAAAQTAQPTTRPVFEPELHAPRFMRPAGLAPTTAATPPPRDLAARLRELVGEVGGGGSDRPVAADVAQRPGRLTAEEIDRALEDRDRERGPPSNKDD